MTQEIIEGAYVQTGTIQGKGEVVRDRILQMFYHKRLSGFVTYDSVYHTYTMLWGLPPMKRGNFERQLRRLCEEGQLEFKYIAGLRMFCLPKSQPIINPVHKFLS